MRIETDFVLFLHFRVEHIATHFDKQKRCKKAKLSKKTFKNKFHFVLIDVFLLKK